MFSSYEWKDNTSQSLLPEEKLYFASTQNMTGDKRFITLLKFYIALPSK